MSEKPFFSFNESIVSNGSMGANVTSSSHEVSEVHHLSLQAIWSAGAAPIGVTALEYSLDGSTFTQDTDSILPVIGNSGSNFYNVANTGFNYVRLVYTRTSGSGTLNVKISGKI